MCTYDRMSSSLTKEGSPPYVIIWMTLDDFEKSTRMRFSPCTLKSVSSGPSPTNEHPEEAPTHRLLREEPRTCLSPNHCSVLEPGLMALTCYCLDLIIDVPMSHILANPPPQKNQITRNYTAPPSHSLFLFAFLRSLANTLFLSVNSVFTEQQK